MKSSRRDFIARSVLASTGLSAGFSTILKGEKVVLSSPDLSGSVQNTDKEAFTISIFSKHLQWLGLKEMAETASQIGFDGLDLTVRPGGHVLPERVETDLPAAVAAADRSGIRVYMITTSIINAEDPVTVKILKTASSLGIRHYRTGYGHYDNSMTIEENMKMMQEKLQKLAEINEKFSISGEYQNHSGMAGERNYFGGPLWDIAGVLKKIGSDWIGSQYDIYHAMIEGGYSWPVDLRLMAPYIRSLDIKDFIWTKRDNGKWSSDTVPLGEGMIDFPAYFRLLKQLNVRCPVSLHFEYPLGGAEHGSRELTMKREDVLAAMKKDLLTLRNYLKEADLV